jgi:neutral amino acid transport system permease protein
MLLDYLFSFDPGILGYLGFLIILVAIFAVFSLGLNLQWGFTGLINFGHVAFMTVGAYTTTLLSSAGTPLFLAVPAGALLAALLGLVMGFSTLRLREDYLAIVTIGVSELVRLFALNEGWLTKGAFGVQNYPLPLAEFRPTIPTRMGIVALVTVVFGLLLWKLGQRFLRLIQDRKQIWSAIATGLLFLLAVRLYIVAAIFLYCAWVNVGSVTLLGSMSIDFPGDGARSGLMLVSLLILLLVYVGLERLVKSPWGRVLKAIREDEQVAKALGKNVFSYKLQSLMLGGFIAGTAGALYAWQLNTVYPTNFEPLVTFNAWIIMILGGAGSNAGTLLGAGIFWAYMALTRFLEGLPALGADRVGALRFMIIGVILMVLMVWRPQGVLGNKDELTLGK